MNVPDPITSAILAAAGAFVAGLAGWVVTSLARERQSKVKELAKRAEKMAKEQSARLSEKADGDVVARLVQKLDEIREAQRTSELAWVERQAKAEAQLTILANNLQGYTNSVSKLEGRVDDMVDQNASQIATLSHLARQMDAIFKVIDARKRASDEAKNHLATSKS